MILKSSEKRTPNPHAIGHFPSTNYDVTINSLDDLVTHNTAILGILGVGKSMLAVEIVERLIANGTHVICLDITDEYEDLLDSFYSKETRDKALSSLAKKIGDGGKGNVQKNVEEGGAIPAFRELLREYLESEITGEGNITIINPAQFEIWRQDSRPFNDTASMQSLTPTEITHIISDITLDILKEKGKTKKAIVCLVYEEAHTLVPEWNSVVAEGDKSATNGTARAILQGRKYGLGCLLITQRTANVTKTILNQCNTIFAMRTFDDTGKEFLANYLGGLHASKLPTLRERQAVFFGKASSCENPVLIRLNDRPDFIEAFRKDNPPPALTPQGGTSDESEAQKADGSDASNDEDTTNSAMENEGGENEVVEEGPSS